jgi:prophage antirepressor-like protein
MDAMRIERWAGHDIRFVLKDKEWWAVAKDVADALGYELSRKAIRDHCNNAKEQNINLTFQNGTSDTCKADNQEINLLRQNVVIGTPSRKRGENKTRKMLIINELDIYRLIFHSKLPEAVAFQDWVFSVVKELRKAAGLAGYEPLRTLSKEFQKKAMTKLHDGMAQAEKIDYVMANNVANRVVCEKWNVAGVMKKQDMPEEMLADRDTILNEVVDLMVANETYKLGLNVPAVIYTKYKKRA